MLAVPLDEQLDNGLLGQASQVAAGALYFLKCEAVVILRVPTVLTTVLLRYSYVKCSSRAGRAGLPARAHDPRSRRYVVPQPL